MSGYTRGPWWLHHEYSTIYVEGRAQDSRVTQEVAAVGPKEGGREQQESDARLIAAAPTLLAALRFMRTRYAAHMDSSDAEAINAAIAKAITAQQAGVEK